MRETIRKELFALADADYKKFTCPLVPNLAPERIIGVRTPALRALAVRIDKSGGSESFLELLPHYYQEENNLHGMLIERIADYSACVARLDAFLPFVDNWATCDLIRPRCFKKHRQDLIGDIRRWIGAEHCYTIRFGLEMLMTHFLDGDFKAEYLALAASVESEEYYVNMMLAWFFATALSKQWESTLPYLEEKRLGPWVHNKTIRKAIESYRISPEQKAYLRGLSVKKEA